MALNIYCGNGRRPKKPYLELKIDNMGAFGYLHLEDKSGREYRVCGAVSNGTLYGGGKCEIWNSAPVYVAKRGEDVSLPEESNDYKDAELQAETYKDELFNLLWSMEAISKRVPL